MACGSVAGRIYQPVLCQISALLLVRSVTVLMSSALVAERTLMKISLVASLKDGPATTVPLNGVQCLPQPFGGCETVTKSLIKMVVSISILTMTLALCRGLGKRLARECQRVIAIIAMSRIAIQAIPRTSHGLMVTTSFCVGSPLATAKR